MENEEQLALLKAGVDGRNESRIRYFGRLPRGVASGSCCVVHLSIGNFVAPYSVTVALSPSSKC